MPEAARVGKRMTYQRLAVASTALGDRRCWRLCVARPFRKCPRKWPF